MDGLKPLYGGLLKIPAPLELSGNWCSTNCPYCFANLNAPTRTLDVKGVSKLLADLDYQESRLLPIEGLLDSGLNNLTSQQIQNLGPQLGYLQGYDYKGFKFFIKEENNPNFVVKGNKRRYATAVNKDGNDVLQSSPSFTLEPDVLIEELKLQIDQKGLVA
jgi:hypothetical protein